MMIRPPSISRRQAVSLLLLQLVAVTAVTAYSDDYVHTPGKCILQGSCNNSLPCAVNGTDPYATDSEHEQLLLDVCPMYANSPIGVCCSKEQLEDFKSQLQVVDPIIGGCEACMHDFKAIECAFFCDPDHSQFVQVTNASYNATAAATVVYGIRYFITTDIAERIFEACRRVKDTISGGIGIAYVCGSANCDQDTFYRSLGDNSYVDLKVDFIIDDTSTVDYVTPLGDEFVYDCDEEVNNKTCSCYDCDAKVCPVVIEEETTVYWHYTLPTGLALWLVLILVVGVATFLHKPKKASNTGMNDIKPVQGQQNQAIDMTSPHLDNRVTVKTNGHVRTSSLQKPPIAPFSPQLSTASTVHGHRRYASDMSSILDHDPFDHDEARSLITKKDSIFTWWLRFGPRLGEMWSDLIYRYCWTVLAVSVIIVVACCAGWYNFSITTDPVKLWTSESSVSRQQKLDYDALFGSSYRACQMVVKQSKGTLYNVNGQDVSGIFTSSVLKAVYDMMNHIENIKVKDASGSSVDYSDICYKPLGNFNTTHPREDCATLSVFQWMDNDRDLLNEPSNYIARFEKCADATLLPECLASFRGPSDTKYVLGGYDEVNMDYLRSNALIVTFALDGSDEKLEPILEWETALKEYLLEQIAEKADSLDIAFSTDRALEDEIDRASHADVFTIILSYILMFVYVGATLGDFDTSLTGCFLNSKALLGVGGVVIAFASVISALGVTSYAGLPSTLIVIEVVPFLILAVGVDNVYIMVQGVQKQIAERIERAEVPDSGSVRGILSSMMRDVFPAMILSSFCQMIAFALGSLSFMPSVQNFAYNATIALALNFFFQSTIFLILLRIDLHRHLSGRLDVLCCIKTKVEKPNRGPCRWFVEDYWCRGLFCSKWIPSLIVILFGGFTIANVMLVPEIKLGLEPTMALPKDSYLIDYYEIAYNDYRVGPGVSFVFKSRDGEPLDLYSEEVYEELVGGEYSLLKTIQKYGVSASYQYIKGSGGSFMDAFEEDWLDNRECCWNRTTEEFCPSIGARDTCSECPQKQLTREERYQYLRWFISDIPRTDGTGCSSGGAVSYADAVVFDKSTNTSVLAGRFTSSHGVLPTSEAFITARQQAIALADEVNAANSLIEVYAYSGYYPYYEQYDTILRECGVNLAVTVLATFLVATILLGFNILASLTIMLSVTMCAVDMIGSMVYLDIPLNAISLVNLLLSVGIAVEFSANIVQAYTVSTEKGRAARAKDALRRTGPAIVSGIAMTNFVGVVILAAAKSQLFVVFYFRMFFTINCLCVLHTILFLPAFLAFLG